MSDFIGFFKFQNLISKKILQNHMLGYGYMEGVSMCGVGEEGYTLLMWIEDRPRVT